MIGRSWVVGCSGVIFSAFVGAPNAASADASEKEQLAEFVVAGMRAERERLRSCSFRAKLTKSQGPRRADDQWEPDSVIMGEIFCACDFEADKVRFDRRETGGAPQPVGGKYIRTPKKTLHAYLSGYIADIKHPTDPGSPMVKPFDVRVVGLTNPQELEDAGWRFEQAMEFYFIRQTVVSATTEKPGLHKITWICGKRNELERTLWVNERRGFTPERLEIRYLNKDGDWQHLQSVRTAWTQMSGVWIPESYSCDSRHFYGTRFELAFDWEQVNGEVDETLFTQEGLNLRKDTLVVDNRLDKPFIVERVGVGKRWKDGGYLKMSKGRPRRSGMSGLRRTLVIVGASALVVVAVIVSLGARKQASS